MQNKDFELLRLVGIAVEPSFRIPVNTAVLRIGYLIVDGRVDGTTIISSHPKDYRRIWVYFIWLRYLWIIDYIS